MRCRSNALHEVFMRLTKLDCLFHRYFLHKTLILRKICLSLSSISSLRFLTWTSSAWNTIGNIDDTSHIFSLLGVTCDSYSWSGTFGRVTEIYLNSVDMRGTLPSSIGNFQSMTFLAIYNSRTSGTIPSTIGALTALQTLALSWNFLDGTIPSTMSALTSMSSLYLQNNYLTMGTATSVPIETFSSYTLSNSMYLDANCLAFNTSSPYPYRHVTATHCRPASKYDMMWCDVLSFYHQLFVHDHFWVKVLYFESATMMWWYECSVLYQ